MRSVFTATARVPLPSALRRRSARRRATPRHAAFAAVRRAVPARPGRARSFPTARPSPTRSQRRSPAEIMRRYAGERKDRADFSLRDFVAANFIIPGAAQSDFRTTPREEIRAHVDRLWARADARAARLAGARLAAARSRLATWCPAAAFARCTTGIPTSRWSDCRPAAATISWPTWSRTSPASSIATATFPMAAAATT